MLEVQRGIDKTNDERTKENKANLYTRQDTKRVVGAASHYNIFTSAVASGYISHQAVNFLGEYALFWRHLENK